MAQELGQITFYLAKKGNSFDSVLQKEKLPEEDDFFKIRNFKAEGSDVRFLCIQSEIRKPNPNWIDFVNEQVASTEDKIEFKTYSKRPSGILLINVNDRVFAATFGVKRTSFLNMRNFHSDFGIKTAMNMCGNKELRQTKSRTHALTTQNIDRQLSHPTDASTFGLSEAELLSYISAHMETDRNITLQGKDSLTVKVIGSNKLTWKRLISQCKTFLKEYSSKKYKELFPNYPNLQEVSEKKANELDQLLIKKLKTAEFSKIHLAIPEFLADDEFSFSYTNYNKKENYIFSHIHINHLKDATVFNLEKIDINSVKNRDVYAYSTTEERILEYKSWNLYDCIVAEIEQNKKYYVLSAGEWRLVDEEFHKSIDKFIDETLVTVEVPKAFQNIDISNATKKENREENFNKIYCQKNNKALLFDQAKLQIAKSKKDKEFCDILELQDSLPMKIIHVKKHGGSDSLNYLFSQARVYCEFFLKDETFLCDIRNHISTSENKTQSTILKTHQR